MWIQWAESWVIYNEWRDEEVIHGCDEWFSCGFHEEVEEFWKVYGVESKELWDGFYGILMGCKEFYGVLVEFSWEFNGIFMLDVGCWMLMHFFYCGCSGTLFFGIQSEFCWGSTGIPVIQRGWREFVEIWMWCLDGVFWRFNRRPSTYMVLNPVLLAEFAVFK